MPGGAHLSADGDAGGFGHAKGADRDHEVAASRGASARKLTAPPNPRSPLRDVPGEHQDSIAADLRLQLGTDTNASGTLGDAYDCESVSRRQAA